MHTTKLPFLFLPLIMAFAAASCSSGSKDYLVDGLRSHQDEQRQLLSLLDKGTGDAETRFALMNRIADNLLAEGNKSNLIIFLTSSVERHPDDPYNAY